MTERFSQSDVDSLKAAEHMWSPCADAAQLIQDTLDHFTRQSPSLHNLSQRMLLETGTRLFDWIDHLVLADESKAQQLAAVGYTQESNGQDRNDTSGASHVWSHAKALLPRVLVSSNYMPAVAIKVESVVDFLAAHGLTDVEISGDPETSVRMACPWREGGHEVWVVERHGDLSLSVTAAENIPAILEWRERFRLRKRDFPTSEAGFAHALELIDEAVTALGVHRACDLFFAAEREYWQHRNRAGREQKARQDRLGLGWANHDHHTYRSSRTHFTRLVECLEHLGFRTRERFYGGSEAGWGAQVLEQPVCGVTIFADVDLSAEEVAGDFAHDGLAPRDKLGTVGLWCALHGEAFLEAGMHHLECQFDFDAARQQLASVNVETMPPFTDFDYLKQAFTKGEIWTVSPQRIDAALAAGYINEAQAERFRRDGAVGSHLEILQRDEGYKGFNQTGISEIITRTDPRKYASA